jgi:nucleoside-diphosphate-sugar epimerase
MVRRTITSWKAGFLIELSAIAADPNSRQGLHISQLGHVKDLAQAMCHVLGSSQAIGQIYNVSGDRYATFDGLARACAEAAGKSPETVQIVHYDPDKFDFGTTQGISSAPSAFLCFSE